MTTLYLIDASGYLYRSYFAIKQMTNARGESTNALFGFIRSLLKLIKEFQPSYMAAVFDGPDNSRKRKEIFPDYKAHRKETPADLIYQMEWAREFCRRMGIPMLDHPGVEADDVMGSVACWAAEKAETDVYLCTGDKDMCQLVNDHIFILNTFKENLILTKEGVLRQFGVYPEQIIDYLTIVGDASDNVPGVAGLGPKTAVDLLARFGSLDQILALPMGSGEKKIEAIKQAEPTLALGRQLLALDKEIPFPKELSFFKLREPSWDALQDFYSDMNFLSLMRELEEKKKNAGREAAADQLAYIIVDEEKELEALFSFLKTQTQICIDTETTGLRPLSAELVGVGLGFEKEKAWYIPVNGHLGLEKVIQKLKVLCAHPGLGFYGHHLKYDLQVLSNYGIEMGKIEFDTLLASYLLNSHSRQHGLDFLSLEYLGIAKIPTQELIGKGKQQISMRDVPLEKISRYCCEDVDCTVRLKGLLAAQLKERGLDALFEKIELPLMPVLAKMERRGIYIDISFLSSLAQEVGLEIQKIEHKIYSLAGEEFNLNSPKQVSEILFSKLAIRPPKKTATGLSTNADVLEELQEKYPIAGAILEYRALEKLRSTYIEALPAEVNPRTGRIHCTFNQSGTATGRLSCQDPNLQNIPVKTPMGRRIREAFRPEYAGWSYLSADYSQIELRLLALLSGDPVLLKAFESGEDIHRFTASLIFGISLADVTAEQRHQAKTVNFGIIYGQQAFGLARELGIDPKTAASFIEMYFSRYKRVKEYLEESKEAARRTGRAVTLLGRERLIPEINSRNMAIRTAAERLAVNTPLQGTQADIIKKAMLDIDTRLSKRPGEAAMILQIHDELIFESPDEELDELAILVRDAMENAVHLELPLIVDIHIGKNWKEC